MEETASPLYPLQYITGELLTDPRFRGTDSAIAVSSASTGLRAYGLLGKLEDAFPYAKFYPGPGRGTGNPTYFMTASCDLHKQVGTARIHHYVEGVDQEGPAVVDLVTRAIPGNPRGQNAYTRQMLVNGDLPENLLRIAAIDNNENRAIWFLAALNHLEELMREERNKDIKSIFVPRGTGSSAIDPFWVEECVPMLAALAVRMQRRGVRVVIVARDSSSWTVPPLERSKSFYQSNKGYDEQGRQGLKRRYPTEEKEQDGAKRDPEDLRMDDSEPDVDDSKPRGEMRTRTKRYREERV